MRKGKDTCELLKTIRKEVAEKYGLDFAPRECHHEGDCAGTCPVCDAELADLQRQLAEKGITDIDLSKIAHDELKVVSGGENNESDYDALEGDIQPPHSSVWWKRPMITEGLFPRNRHFGKWEEAGRRVVYKECPIAGWQLHHLEDIWDELYEGAELALVRDKHNKHDSNAVAVALDDDYWGTPEDFNFDFILGYVPREYNETVAKLLDMGWDDVLFACISTVEGNGHRESNLRMTIYIQRNMNADK